MSTKRTGRIVKVSGNMVTVACDTFVVQNEVVYIIHGDERLKAEVIRVRGNRAEAQVYENTNGLKIGDEAEFTNELLSVELGPGFWARYLMACRTRFLIWQKSMGSF